VAKVEKFLVAIRAGHGYILIRSLPSQSSKQARAGARRTRNDVTTKKEL